MHADLAFGELVERRRALRSTTAGVAADDATATPEPANCSDANCSGVDNQAAAPVVVGIGALTDELKAFCEAKLVALQRTLQRRFRESKRRGGAGVGGGGAGVDTCFVHDLVSE